MLYTYKLVCIFFLNKRNCFCFPWTSQNYQTELVLLKQLHTVSLLNLCAKTKSIAYCAVQNHNQIIMTTLAYICT